jgi:hypothetical protein
MIPGVRLSLGDKDFIVPPLTLGMLRNGLLVKLEEHDRLVGQDGEQWNLVDLRGQIILAALRRNYSETDLPESEFWDRMDMGNVNQAWVAVLGISGFIPVGETPAAVETGISDQSINPSPPPMVGPIGR